MLNVINFNTCVTRILQSIKSAQSRAKVPRCKLLGRELFNVAMLNILTHRIAVLYMDETVFLI